MECIKTPIEKSTEDVYHTPGADDQQVTKSRGTEATNKEDGSLPKFDEMQYLDILYGQGLLYPFYAETMEDTGEKGQHPNEQEEPGHNPSMLLMLRLSPI